jgi:glycosyltransferase involved in cell wall biosynthesis
MRILMLSQFYPPIIGGTEQHVRNLSIELASRGHEVAVATIRHEDQAKFEIDHGVRVYRIRSSMQRVPWLFGDNRRQHAPPFPDPEMMLELRRIILGERPEIVHAHNWLVRSFLPLKTWCKARLIVTLHDYRLACAKETLIYHDALCDGPHIVKCLGCAAQHYGLVKGMPTVMSNWVMGLAEREFVDMFIAVSQATAVGNSLIGSGLRFQIIPNFIANDLSMQQSNSEPYLKLLPAEDYLLFVGALGHTKGVDVLLRAYSGLTNAPPLVLIGYQTPDWPLSTLDSLSNVFVFKDWPHDAVMGAWSRCSIGLIPSIWAETFGIVALEAMSMGKPIIASRIGGLSDVVIDGETGFLVPPGDPQALREAIQCLLDDPALRECMGHIAKQRVVEFQTKSVVPCIEQVYQEILAS